MGRGGGPMVLTSAETQIVAVETQIALPTTMSTRTQFCVGPERNNYRYTAMCFDAVAGCVAGIWKCCRKSDYAPLGFLLFIVYVGDDANYDGYQYVAMDVPADAPSLANMMEVGVPVFRTRDANALEDGNHTWEINYAAHSSSVADWKGVYTCSTGQY